MEGAAGSARAAPEHRANGRRKQRPVAIAGSAVKSDLQKEAAESQPARRSRRSKHGAPAATPARPRLRLPLSGSNHVFAYLEPLPTFPWFVVYQPSFREKQRSNLRLTPSPDSVGEVNLT